MIRIEMSLLDIHLPLSKLNLSKLFLDTRPNRHFSHSLKMRHNFVLYVSDCWVNRHRDNPKQRTAQRQLILPMIKRMIIRPIRYKLQRMSPIQRGTKMGNYLSTIHTSIAFNPLKEIFIESTNKYSNTHQPCMQHWWSGIEIVAMHNMN